MAVVGGEALDVALEIPKRLETVRSISGHHKPSDFYASLFMLLDYRETVGVLREQLAACSPEAS